MLSEQNLECTIRPLNSPNKIEANADLLEYQYNRFFQFWFGVATTTVPVDDVLGVCEKVTIEFEDGRVGVATIREVFPKQGVFCIVPFVGILPLIDLPGPRFKPI